MEVKGKIIKVLPQESGTTKNGNGWVRSKVIIETTDEYPKKIAVELNKQGHIDKVAQMSLGTEISIMVNVESKEYNGKWFTSLKGWSL